MEVIRNLPYAEVGTVGGVPSGALLQTEPIIINSLPFTVTTSIVYIDDPYDGVAPNDTINTDYKRVRTEITWGGIYPSRVPMTLVTNIAPKGVETTTGGGTLFVRVFNANGVAIPNATVKIDNTDMIPEIHTQTLTDATGSVNLPGSPACVTCYQVTITKTNFSTDKTYSTNEAANPLQPHATVIEGQTTQISFAIDQVSSIRVNSYGSRESGYPPIANVFFTLRGSKIIGYDTSDNPVYKYEYTTNTGGSTVNISDLEWGTYTLDFAASGHNLAGSNPVTPFSLTPATALTVAAAAVPKSNTSLLVVMKNSAQELLASATAELASDSIPYLASTSAGPNGAADFGQAFFGSLTPALYSLKVTLAGFQEATSSVSLTSNQQETVTLNLAE
jgi:hypothetical protein